MIKQQTNGMELVNRLLAREGKPPVFIVDDREDDFVEPDYESMSDDELYDVRVRRLMNNGGYDGEGSRPRIDMGKAWDLESTYIRKRQITSDDQSTYISECDAGDESESTYNKDNKDKKDKKDYNAITTCPSDKDLLGDTNKELLVDTAICSIGGGVEDSGEIDRVGANRETGQAMPPAFKPGSTPDHYWCGLGPNPDEWAPPPTNQVAGMPFNRIHLEVIFENQTKKRMEKNVCVEEWKEPYWSVNLHTDTNLEDLPTWERTDKATLMLMDDFYYGAEDAQENGWDNVYRLQEAHGMLEHALYDFIKSVADPETTTFHLGGMGRFRNNPDPKVKNGWEYTTVPNKQKHPNVVVMVRVIIPEHMDEIDINDQNDLKHVQKMEAIIVYDHQVFELELRKKPQKGYWWHGYFKPSNNKSKVSKMKQGKAIIKRK